MFEILTISDEIRQLFLDDAPRHELYAQAMKDGLTLLRTDGMMKVKEHKTTPYEVMRVMFSLE